MSDELPGVTDDAILDGRLRLYQPERGHRFGHDAILLAAATPARPGDRVVELGAGVGAASLALLARVPRIHVILVDIDARLTALASENIARNGFTEQAQAVTLDVGAVDQRFSEAGLQAGVFDQVMMNPPFNAPSLQASPDRARRTAHAASDDTLRLWLRQAARLLRISGGMTLIWRAEDQAEVVQEIAAEFGAVTILPVHPAPDKPAIRILVNARKGKRETLRILPPLTLADEQRRPSAAAEAILRAGEPLSTG
jgi:tRNA1(Val) A37 N6-methylase TrmN6